MGLLTRKVRIGDALFDFTGDAGYLNSMGDTFEPSTLDMLSSMVARDSHVIDVGANIGFTTVALSNFCPDGWVAAVEPVPRTFALLEENVKAAHATNVSCHNFALGAADGELVMQGNPNFLAGSFVADKFSIDDEYHFAERVPVHTLDAVLEQTGLRRLDAMKIDVEGFELDVFAGAKKTLSVFEPLVFMEMNHWCLSMFRRMTIPEFRERLLKIFPCAYAIQDAETRDLTDERAAYHVAHEHLNHGKFFNLLVGFNRDIVDRALDRYLAKRSANALPTTHLSPHEAMALIERAEAAEQRARVFEHRASVLQNVVSEKEKLIWHLEAQLASAHG
jgi:FkbM family methyltransferase